MTDRMIDAEQQVEKQRQAVAQFVEAIRDDPVMVAIERWAKNVLEILDKVAVDLSRRG